MRSKTRVFLINPPQKYYGNSLCFNVSFPIGFLNLAAMVKDICNVTIFDYLVENFSIKKNDNWTLYGTLLNILKQKIMKYGPVIIGITIPFSAQSENSKKVAIACRKAMPNSIILMDGPHTAIKYEDFAKATQFFRAPLISTKEFPNKDLKTTRKNFEDKMNKLILNRTYR